MRSTASRCQPRNLLTYAAKVVAAPDGAGEERTFVEFPFAARFVTPFPTRFAAIVLELFFALAPDVVLSFDRVAA